MSIITAKGRAAREKAQQQEQRQKIDWKKVHIRLKDGESVRVRILSPEDYVEYYAHGAFNKNIYSQPCIEPAGQRCALCEAAKYSDEWSVLRRKPRYLFAFADIDAGEIRVFDASKSQATALIGVIEEYADSLDQMIFTLKRTGSGQGTTYTLLPKPVGATDKEKFAKFDGKVVDVSFFETVLRPRTRDQQIEELERAGFPVQEVFAGEVVTPVEEDDEDEFGF